MPADKLENPGWKSITAFVVAVLLAAAGWFDLAGLESFSDALSVTHLPSLLLSLGPVFWAYGLGGPVKK
jgi:hypothetical protein